MGQTTGVRGQLVGGVALASTSTHHLEPTDVIEGAGGHHEVLERTTGDRVHRRVQVTETQPVTERFDVTDGPTTPRDPDGRRRSFWMSSPR